MQTTTTCSETHLRKRIDELTAYIQEFGSVLVAYSGGVDSTFLAAVTHQALGDRMLAVTLSMASVPERHLQRALDFAETLGFPYLALEEDQFAMPGFVANAPNRCYFCKLAIMRRANDLAREHGLEQVIDGANEDDRGDFRPGSRAVHECGVRSPLAELHWTKLEIRAASRLLGLPSADLPSYACLASRVPYDEPITPEKLTQVDAVEALLDTMGLAGGRARHHGDILRLELTEEGFDALSTQPGLRNDVLECAKRVGFRYVTLDLELYRTGRLNEVLDDSKGPHGK
ncbi:MAG: ATP-dependent sacrificial sulfur transferase LarE [Lentisphaeria bacterium]|nr:ATP-dependent sacrificial sulfur transferase LarE [Lentisphaeria bacterium]